MKPSDLFLFVARCLSMDENPAAGEEVMVYITEGTIRWEDFVWKTSSHYVLPAIFSIFKRNGILPLLPPELVVYLERLYDLNSERNLKITGQCREINSLLRHNGVEPLFLKGAGLLLSGLFRDPAERMMEDIDLLVSREEIRKAMQLLEAEGYSRPEVSAEEVYLDHHHLPPLIHPHKPAAVELHLAPYHRLYLPLASPEEIFQRSVFTGNGAFRVPSPADSRLICFAHEHRAARGYLSNIPSLKGMYDYFLLSHRAEDQIHFPEGKMGNDFRRIDHLTRRAFRMENDGRLTTPEEGEKWWKREMFLMDHPVWDRVWNRSVFVVKSRIGG